MNSRRSEIKLEYEGVDISQDIAPFLTSFTFTDNGTAKADDLQISLSDRQGLWRDPWMPQRGDRIKAEIIFRNWRKEGDLYSLPCGVFSVDTVDFNGPPDVVTIQAASYPGTSPIKNEPRTKSWENVTLRQIASRIADRAGLKLMFEAFDVSYDRLDQSEETDLSFLAKISEEEGITVKITNNTLVLFDDRKYEAMEPVRTIIRGESNVINYNFNLQTVGVSYAACEISYFDSSNNRTISGTFRIPGATGPILKRNERVSSEAEAIRKARNLLRKQNQEAQKAIITIVGDHEIVQGVTVLIKNFGKFDDKYIVESVRHNVGSGYQTAMELRKVLAY